MPDRSAADRAAEVLRQVRMEWRDAWLAAFKKDADLPPIEEAFVAALMADPVIVDLAIEAGWLGPAESVFETFIAGDGERSMRGRSDLLERREAPYA